MKPPRPPTCRTARQAASPRIDANGDFQGPWWKFSLRTALLVLCAALFCFPVTDPDYFWHVNTGRWIVEHGVLPDVDPFKFTCEGLAPGSREANLVRLFLRGYWLGDLALCAVDSLAGVSGMVVLRVATYLAILSMMLHWLEARKSGAIGFIWVCLLALQMLVFPSERPQLFAFLFFPILVNSLDLLGTSAGRMVTVRGAGICLLMLLWANIHGSFVLGVLVIGGSAFGLVIDERLNRRRPDPRMYAWLTAACLITLLNPNGAALAIEALQSRGGESTGIRELASPIRDFGGRWPQNIGYWGTVGLTAFTIATRIRRMKTQHTIVALGMLAMSLTACRHMLYLPLAGLAIAPYLGSRLPWGKAGYLCGAGVLLAAAWCADKSGMLTPGQSTTFPEAAVAFMADNPTAEKLFNFYDWGGYIPYKMPGKRVFIDGRSVVARTEADFARMLDGTDWQRLFDTYGIGTAILPAIDPFSGLLCPLATSLIASPDWALVHADDAALVFARNITANRQVIEARRLSVTDFFEHVLQVTDHYRPRWRNSRFFHSTRGIALANLKRWDEAIDCLSAALAMDPTDEVTAEALRQVISRAGARSRAQPAD